MTSTTVRPCTLPANMPAATPGTSVANGMSDEGIPLEAISSIGDSTDFYELIGKFGDKDGERNDEVCSDGLDNDGNTPPKGED